MSEVVKKANQYSNVSNVTTYKHLMSGYNETIHLAVTSYLQLISKLLQAEIINSFYDSPYCRYDTPEEFDMFVYNNFILKPYYA